MLASQYYRSTSVCCCGESVVHQGLSGRRPVFRSQAVSCLSCLCPVYPARMAYLAHMRPDLLIAPPVARVLFRSGRV